MMCVVNLFLSSHSSRVLSGDGLVGGNPTLNTPRLRRGGGISSSLNLVFTCIGTSYWYIVYFVCDSASELERWALLLVTNLLLVFAAYDPT